MKEIILISLLLITVGCVTQKKPVEDKELQITSDVRELILAAAEYGVAESQYQAGNLYLIGESVPKNHALAKEWFEKSANQGYAPAQSMLGAMYSSGQGAPLDYVLAKYWYEKAAIQNDSVAQYNLGVLYLNGLGTSKNCKKAIEYLEAASNSGAIVDANFISKTKSECQQL